MGDCTQCLIICCSPFICIDKGLLAKLFEVKHVTEVLIHNLVTEPNSRFVRFSYRLSQLRAPMLNNQCFQAPSLAHGVTFSQKGFESTRSWVAGSIFFRGAVME